MRLLFLTLVTFSLSAQTITIAQSGTRTSQQGPAENFTGSVRVDPYFQATDITRATGALVTFDAAAHTARHAHPTGQVLIVTAGTGRVQRGVSPSTKSASATSCAFRRTTAHSSSVFPVCTRSRWRSRPRRRRTRCCTRRCASSPRVRRA